MRMKSRVTIRPQLTARKGEPPLHMLLGVELSDLKYAGPKRTSA